MTQNKLLLMTFMTLITLLAVNFLFSKPITPYVSEPINIPTREVNNYYNNYEHYTISDGIESYIDNIKQSLTRKGRIKRALKVVHSIEYKSDGDDDYPQFPFETLRDGTGDCEDTSFLLATLLLGAGENPYYIQTKNHILVAVKKDLNGETNQENLCFLETTKDIGLCALPSDITEYKLIEIKKD